MPQSLFQTLEKIAVDQQFKDIQSQLTDLKHFRDDHQFIDVVVLGQFKAGKSSLINDLMGRPILPVGVLPVTAVITRIFYGESEKIKVQHLDGRRHDIEPDDLKEYITEERNPENEKQVYLVDITLPALKSYQKIRFIDTPGLGSAFEHNTTVTENWYNKIGIAFVVISAIQPLSANDLELISTAVGQSPEVHLIVSKVDLLSQEEMTKVVDFLSQRTRELFKKEFKIFPYTILKGHDAMKTNIHQAILKPLSENPLASRQSIYQHKLKHLAALSHSYLEIRMQMAGKKADERRALKDKILDEQLQLSFVKNELAYISNHYESQTRSHLEKIFLDKNYPVLLQHLTNNLKLAYAGWTGNLYRVSRQYEQWLKQSMKTQLQEMEYQSRSFTEGLLSEAQEHFNHYTAHFRERLNQRIERVLQVSLPPEDFSVTIEPLEKPDISTSWAFESHIDLLWFLVPMRLMRKTFLNSFVRQLPRESEKNLRRLISILTTNINKAIAQSQAEALEYIETRLQNMEDLLSTEDTDVEKFSGWMEKLALWSNAAGAKG